MIMLGVTADNPRETSFHPVGYVIAIPESAGSNYLFKDIPGIQF
jgi:hypothetical protein